MHLYKIWLFAAATTAVTTFQGNRARASEQQISRERRGGCVALGSFPAVVLDCTFLWLHDVPDGISPHIHQLWLSHNEMTQIEDTDFQGLKSIRHLYLDNNAISKVHANSFDGLTSLHHLLLNANFISQFPNGVFDALTQLKTLNLQDNFISELQALQFSKMKSLTSLVLRRNQIQTIECGWADKLRSLVRIRHDAAPKACATLSKTTNSSDAARHGETAVLCTCPNQSDENGCGDGHNLISEFCMSAYYCSISKPCSQFAVSVENLHLPSAEAFANNDVSSTQSVDSGEGISFLYLSLIVGAVLVLAAPIIAYGVVKMKQRWPHPEDGDAWVGSEHSSPERAMEWENMSFTSEKSQLTSSRFSANLFSGLTESSETDEDSVLEPPRPHRPTMLGMSIKSLESIREVSPEGNQYDEMNPDESEYCEATV